MNKKGEVSLLLVGAFCATLIIRAAVLGQLDKPSVSPATKHLDTLTSVGNKGNFVHGQESYR
jgi:hypothetical protein